MSDAEDARFKAFLAATDADERDWVAFFEFEHAVDEAAHEAAMINLYDEPRENARERGLLRTVLWDMLHRVLPRIGLGEVISNAPAIGCALRFGLIPPKADALDHIGNPDALDQLCEKGVAAQRAHSERITEERATKLSRRSRKHS